MSDKILTPAFRAGFINVFKARANKNEDGSVGAAKFSIRACFPPDTDLAPLKALAGSVITAKFGDKPPKTFRSPFRRNDELDNPIVGLGDDWIIMSYSANEDSRPGLVDTNKQDIIDDSQVYSGAWFRAQVDAYWYDKKGNKGVAFGLHNVQKLRDDDPIGKGKMPASKAFEAVAGAASAPATAGGLFD